jgi:KaiC/GvpD/RAD55 family RecA-like ATPase
MIVARVPSGIPGLDGVLQGGIPANSTIALRAEPSNFTECIVQQFVAEGLKHGAPAIYCCLSRPVAHLIDSMKQQGFDVLEPVANDQLVIIDCYSMQKRTAGMGVEKQIQKKIISVPEVDDERLLQDGLAAAVERMANLKGVRAVCESVPGTLTSRGAIEIMRWGRRAFADLRAFEAVAVHTFPTGVREDLFSMMAHDFDGILEVGSDRSGERMRHYISIPKMRMTAVPQKVMDLDMEENLVVLKTTQRIV